MKKVLRLAVLLCILLLLLSGCGDTETKKAENIYLSNMKTSASELSQQEKDRMDAVSRMLEGIRLEQSNDYAYVVCGKNTTDRNLSISLHFSGYDAQGCLTYKTSSHLNQWDKDQLLSNCLSNTPSEAIETLTVVGEYSDNGCWYMTEPVSVPMDSGSGSTITVGYAKPLPVVVSMEQSWGDPVGYTLLETGVEVTDYSDYLYMVIRKENGSNNDSDTIPYRIVDAEGVVHASGSETVYLNKGETMRLRCLLSLSVPGEYYLELR